MGREREGGRSCVFLPKVNEIGIEKMGWPLFHYLSYRHDVIYADMPYKIKTNDEGDLR